MAGCCTFSSPLRRSSSSPPSAPTTRRPGRASRRRRAAGSSGSASRGLRYRRSGPGARLHAARLGTPRHDLREVDLESRRGPACRLSTSARGRRRFPGGLERRQDVHVHGSAGLSVQRRQPGARDRVRPGDQPCLSPATHITRPPVRPRHRRCRPGRLREGDAASGVVARGNTLVVRLTRAAPDFPSRTASTYFCAVPPTLPIDPEGAGAFPAAGPYYVFDYSRRERIVMRGTRSTAGAALITSTASRSICGPRPRKHARRVDRGEADWGYTLSGIYFDPSLGLVEKYGSTARSSTSSRD